MKSRPISLEEAKLIANRYRCEREHLFFTRYFFKARMAQKFIINWHHHLIADTVDDVLEGRKQDVVINVSPGGTKTELVVISFIARGLAKNSWCRFLHLSASEILALLNSSTARDIVQSDEYQAMWPLQIASDEKSKKRWNVIVNGKKAGGVYATAMGGQVTGFRAGHMAPGFQGAIIIDDPLKPEDAFSKPAIEEANRKLLTTVKSRKANPSTPLILIMQRVAENDPAGFILGGNVPGNWSHVKIPAIMNEAYIESLPDKYKKLAYAAVGSSDAEVIDGECSYWPYKEPLQELIKMRRGDGKNQQGQRISRHVFSSQYDQAPKAIGGNFLKGKDFIRYRETPKIRYRKIFADTAQKTKEANDYSVFEEWGLGDDGKIYLLDLIRGRWEAPDLIKMAVALWAKAKARDVLKYGQVRQLVVEDKSSGTGLIQTIKLPPYNIPVFPVERHKDKFTRVLDIQAYVESGQVCIPEDAPFTLDFISECEAFTADDTHAHDDQIDPLCDAVNDMLSSQNPMKVWAAAAGRK